eukprot:CAMPEP_0184725990 /NCGR_PEP_ID=MMETSP0314-20130426/32455_1 /TAXON_ID=38298 /ORGANISM="Rhodella maculata, Strain CCMP 736" /LENGTH=219 /DNA_ID=CAMNT_0027191331 /DNA_START=136 /DNA_END=793 /DNA_ORIENTATION=-
MPGIWEVDVLKAAPSWITTSLYIASNDRAYYSRSLERPTLETTSRDWRAQWAALRSGLGFPVQVRILYQLELVWGVVFADDYEQGKFASFSLDGSYPTCSIRPLPEDLASRDPEQPFWSPESPRPDDLIEIQKCPRVHGNYPSWQPATVVGISRTDITVYVWLTAEIVSLRSQRGFMEWRPMESDDKEFWIAAALEMQIVGEAVDEMVACMERASDIST